MVLLVSRDPQDLQEKMEASDSPDLPVLKGNQDLVGKWDLRENEVSRETTESRDSSVQREESDPQARPVDPELQAVLDSMGSKVNKERPDLSVPLEFPGTKVRQAYPARMA